MQASVDAAVAGAITLLLTGDNTLTSGVAELKARLDEVDEALTGQENRTLTTPSTSLLCLLLLLLPKGTAGIGILSPAPSCVATYPC